MEDDLRIGTRHEQRPFVAQVVPERHRIGQVPIMGECEVSVMIRDVEGLDIGSLERSAGRRVSVVTDSMIPAQCIDQDLFVREDFKDMTMIFMDREFAF